MLFSPQLTYSSAAGASAPAEEREALPEQALAYAAGAPAAEPVARTPAPPPAPTSRAAAPHPPEKREVLLARAVKESAFVFNEAQIASIKQRLALTPDQQRYWPAVAAALRSITRQRAPDGSVKVAAGRGTAIDPNSPEVQRLKSAAIPLIFTMREEQKHEVRMLAHLMGLESVAASF
jgi:hypothetical protein